MAPRNDSGNGSATNVLMVVAVIAVAFSLFNLIVTINKVGDIRSMTGFQVDDGVQFAPTDVGTADVEILAAVNIQFIVTALDWGAGSVVVPGPALLDTAVAPFHDALWIPLAGDAPVDPGPDGIILEGGLELENFGNVDVNLFVETLNDADAFICSSDATCIATADQDFRWKFEDVEVGSCGDKDIDNVVPDPDIFWTSFQTVCTTGDVTCDLTGDGLFVCDQFLSLPASNLIEIDFELVIPLTAPIGQRPQEVITATAIVS